MNKTQWEWLYYLMSFITAYWILKVSDSYWVIAPLVGLEIISYCAGAFRLQNHEVSMGAAFLSTAVLAAWMMCLATSPWFALPTLVYLVINYAKGACDASGYHTT